MKAGIFQSLLREYFGEGARDFSQDLQDALRDLVAEAFELGASTPHTCGNFDPTSQGPVGPEGCRACQFLSEE